MTTPSAGSSHEARSPAKRSDRHNALHIDLPPPPAFKETAASGTESHEGDSGSKSTERPTMDTDASEEGLGGNASKQAVDGPVSQGLLSVQSEQSSALPSSESPSLRPSVLDRSKTSSSSSSGKKSTNLLTPMSSNPSSHGATSPIMSDALEYFSETAAKISEDGAGGFMIQSPDGRPAGIFFQPRTRLHTTAGRVGGSTRRSTQTARPAGADAAVESSRARTTSEITGKDKAKVPLISLKEIVDTHKQASEAPGSAAMERDGTDSTVTGGGEAHTPKGEPGQDEAGLKPSGQPHMTAIPHEPVASQGKIYSPQVGIQSVLAADMPLPSSHDSAHAGFSGPNVGAVQGNAEEHAQAVPPNVAAGKPAAASGVASAPSAGIRPSAQPQAGVLIGAGFEPARKKAGTHHKKAAKDTEVLPPIKVLIVDDNPINVKILSTWLEKRKINIGIARDGREAVREWQTGGYQLILMDIQLPVMDGIEATKEIRRLEREASIDSAYSPSIASATASAAKQLGAPSDSKGGQDYGGGHEGTVTSNIISSALRSSVIIVALTASVLNSDRVAALAAGCNDFLNKPVNMRWLERKVTEWGSMQYLISFRTPAGYDERHRKRRRAGDRNDGQLLHPSSASHDGGAANDAMVRRAFGHAPDSMAREVAERLYIGGNGRPQKA